MILAVSSFFQHPAIYPAISGAPDHLRYILLILDLCIDFSFTKMYNNFNIYLDALRGGDQLNDRI